MASRGSAAASVDAPCPEPITNSGDSASSSASAFFVLYLSNRYPRRRRPRENSAAAAGSQDPVGASKATRTLFAVVSLLKTKPPIVTKSRGAPSFPASTPMTMRRGASRLAGARISRAVRCAPLKPYAFAAARTSGSRSPNSAMTDGEGFKSAPTKITTAPVLAAESGRNAILRDPLIPPFNPLRAETCHSGVLYPKGSVGSYGRRRRLVNKSPDFTDMKTRCASSSVQECSCLLKWELRADRRRLDRSSSPPSSGPLAR